MLHYTPQDEIDKGMFCLFAEKGNPKELFETIQETINNRQNNLKHPSKSSNGDGSSSNNSGDGDDSSEGEEIDPELSRQIQEFMNRQFVYYQLDLPEGLSLSSDQLEILKGKVGSFEKDYKVRKGRLDMLHKGVKYLYDELKTLPEERLPLEDNLDEAYLEKVCFVRARFFSLIVHCSSFVEWFWEISLSPYTYVYAY